MWIDIIMDAVLDCLRTLPFLLAAFLLVEWTEHRAGHIFEHWMEKAGRLGPIIGALLGCVPQCGFSVLSVNLYAAGFMTTGALIAVMAATSDEAILILLAHPEHFPTIFRLVAAKVVIGVAAGFLIDVVFEKYLRKQREEIEDICVDCGCEGGSDILRPALKHTVRVFLYLLIITFCLNALMELGGEDFLTALFLKHSPMQPLVTALVGMIPNCAASVIMTKLFLEGMISFGSAIAGLVSGAGVGLLVLFRVCSNKKLNLEIMGLLYVTACISGIVLNLL